MTLYIYKLKSDIAGADIAEWCEQRCVMQVLRGVAITLIEAGPTPKLCRKEFNTGSKRDATQRQRDAW